MEKMDMTKREVIALFEAAEVYEGRRDTVDLSDIDWKELTNLAEQAGLTGVLQVIESGIEGHTRKHADELKDRLNDQLRAAKLRLEEVERCKQSLKAENIKHLFVGDQAISKMLSYRIIPFEKAEVLVLPENIERAKKLVESPVIDVICKLEGICLDFDHCAAVRLQNCLSPGLAALRLCRKLEQDPQDLRSLFRLFFLLEEQVEDLELLHLLGVTQGMESAVRKAFTKIAKHFVTMRGHSMLYAYLL